MTKYNLAYGEMTYEEYINSWQWKEKSEWIIHTRKNKCERCGKSKSDKKVILQVHHINYESIGNEASEDVIVLCKKCHEKEHKKRWKKKTNLLKHS
jgi:hypothetical protein